MPKENPTFGYDYDLARWSTGDTDADGRVIWHESLPANSDWEHIRMVTLDLNPEGDPFYRNYHISPHRPLDVYGSDDPDAYDLDDLAAQAFLSYGFEF